MIEVDEEIGFGYCVVAGCCFLGSLTLLRDPAEPTDWDSMRMFLRVVMALSGYAGGLMLCSLGLRRLMLSFAFLLHFAGICSAALAAPPAAWIVQQTWMRFFRPYLEFMYLNNAYHFYAPDPGPSSYLWFRVILTDEKGENDHGLWYKLPQVDDKGRLKHPVALEYQRYLSMTESVAQKDSLPSDYYFDEKQQQWLPRPMFANRLKLAQPAAGLLVIGVPEVNQPRIPFHPDISLPNQVNIPSDGPRRLLSSYARHIAEKYDTYTDDDGKVWKFKSVKIYRVIHNIPPVIWFRNKWSPTDPTLYQPFYVGNYNAEGRLLKDNDPYLYWLLPIIRQRPNDPNSVIYDYCRKHAGDPHWERKVGDPD
jgi:hypothetical protein